MMENQIRKNITHERETTLYTGMTWVHGASTAHRVRGQVGFED